MNKEHILISIIEGYRQSIHRRYQYQKIKDNYEIPESIDEDTVNTLRNYWLKYIYPDYEKRKELNEAFQSLDDYIKHPKKLMRLLLDATKLIFNYGRHLPKILSSGLKAMKTYKAAERFETKLVEEAIKNEIKAPFNETKINALIKLLPRDEIERFIDISQSLFEILHDRIQMAKIKEIISYLIFAMKKSPEFYSISQIKGLEIGLEMLTEGDKLFTQLSEEDQRKLVYLITDIERDVMGYNE